MPSKKDSVGLDLGFTSLKYSTVVLFAVFGTILPRAAFAQDTPAGKGGISPLSKLEELKVHITGDSFDFSRDKGLLVIEGNVVVTFSDFVIRCDALEVSSGEGEKPLLRAYPAVNMDYSNGLAEFAGGEFRYDFNTGEGGFGKVEGVIHLDPARMDIQLEVPQDAFFKADALLIYSDRFILRKPWFSLGRKEKSEIRFYSAEVVANIQESRIVSAEIDKFTVDIFGMKITLLPMRLKHGFVKRPGVGFTGYLPSVSFDAADGLGIDQKVFYTFASTPKKETFFSFRINPYIPDRFYWQVGLNQAFQNGRVSLIYGPERLEDPFYESQVVWSKPDLRVNYNLPRMGDWRHFVKGYWGNMREASTGVKDERYGFDYRVGFKPVEFGRLALRLSGGVTKNYYSCGDEYLVLERTAALLYDGGRDFDCKLSYTKNDDDGATPFLYDRVKVREGVGFKVQTFFSTKWGVASDLLYDLDKEDFEHLGFGPIWVTESLQLGFVWDFEDKSVRLIAGLPKQFN